ncbi:MAG: histidine ammonia-lyase, partial [Bacteroidetes bacterium]
MKEDVYLISPEKLTFKAIFDILKKNKRIRLSDVAIEKIQKCRTYLDDKIKNQDEPIYGINTGFGALYNKNISREDLGRLQENLVKSHACGTGDKVPEKIVKLMILLKIQSLSYGHSGVQLSTVQRLVDLFNEDIIPVVYEQGSLGASGDLS